MSPEASEIVKLLQSNEPRILIVIGAGVSRGATGKTHAGWSGLLEHGIHYRFERGDITEKRRNELVTGLKEAFDPFDLIFRRKRGHGKLG